MRIKNRSNQASERTAPIAGGYSKNASVDSVTQEVLPVNASISENTASDPKTRQVIPWTNRRVVVLHANERPNGV